MYGSSGMHEHTVYSGPSLGISSQPNASAGTTPSQHRPTPAPPPPGLRLVHRQTLRELQSTAEYQRKILAAAVQLVKPGGALVFSTCSINPGEPARSATLGHAVYGELPGHCTRRVTHPALLLWVLDRGPSPSPSPLAFPHNPRTPTHPTPARPIPPLTYTISHVRAHSHPYTTPSFASIGPVAGENEANVRWLLDTYSFLRLVQQSPRLGQAGLTGGQKGAARRSWCGNLEPQSWCGPCWSSRFAMPCGSLYAQCCCWL